MFFWFGCRQRAHVWCTLPPKDGRYAHGTAGGSRAAGFRSLTEAIDTTTPAGRMMMQTGGQHSIRPWFALAAWPSRIRQMLPPKDGRIGGRRPETLGSAAVRDSKDGFQGGRQST